MAKGKTATKPPREISDYNNKVTQNLANHLLEGRLLSLSHPNTENYWKFINQEHQKDKGIDYHVEIEQVKTRETLFTFHIQNKGCSKQIDPLRTTENKGLLAYPISIRHTNYYRYEIQSPMVFTVCDIESGKVYWHPVQLDDALDIRLEKATSEDKYLRIYIDPNKELTQNNISELIKDLKKSYQQQKVRFQRKRAQTIFADDFEQKIDRTKHILDQLHDYLNYTHKYIRYVPIRILTAGYPFKEKKSYYPYYSDFSITTDNTSLLEMLTKLEVTDHKHITINDSDYFKDVEDAQEKLKFVFATLSHNLIYEIREHIHTKGFHIHLENDDIQYISEKLFDELKLSDLFDHLATTEPTSDREKMAIAYQHYQLGNYLKSAKLFKEISLAALIEKKYELYFICRFNLSKLFKLITHRILGKPIESPLVKEIESINIDDDFETYKTKDNEKLLDSIRKLSFLYECKEEILQTLEKIKGQYYSGGTSSLNYVVELLTTYADLDQFMNMNHIVFDMFTEFKEIFQLVMEGWFIALNTPYLNNWRLPHLEDWMIHRIIFYGKRGKIIANINRYKLKELRYKENTDISYSFVKVLKYFFDEADKIDKKYKIIKEEQNYKFNQFYTERYDNLIILAAVTTLSDNAVLMVSQGLRKYIAVGAKSVSYEQSNISMFLEHKVKQLPVSEIREWLQDFITNPRIHNLDLFENICNAAKYHEWKIELSDEQFSDLYKISFDNWPGAAKDIQPQFLIYVQRFLAREDQKNLIIDRLKEMLEMLFDMRLCYDACIYGIIPFEGKLATQFIEKTNPETRIARPSFSLIDEEYIAIPYLHELLNLCFKYAIPLSTLKFDKYFQNNEYYKWLFNIDGYDYSKWNPRWLGEHPTIYFFKEFRKHAVIKQQLEQYLSNRSDSTVERLYFDLYSDIRISVIE